MAWVPVLCLFSGCASTRQYVPLPDMSKRIGNPQQSRIVVMRPGRAWASVPVAVRDGETRIGRIGPNGYLCWERPPGATTVTTEGRGAGKRHLTLQPGQDYYLIASTRLRLSGWRHRLMPAEWSGGLMVLDGCKPPPLPAGMRSGARGASLSARPAAGPQ